MTNQSIKFYKFSSSSTSADKIAAAKATQGAVIYIVDARELWIGGATAAQAQLVIKGANDVTFNNNVLTLTHYDNAGTATTQTLDFSDVASASSTFKVFEKMYTLMGTSQTGETGDEQQLDYSGTNYLSELGTAGNPNKNLVNADKALDAAIHNNTTMAADSAAVYDTEHLSSTWTTVVNANEIEAGDAVTADVEKLDKKVARLADEVIANEQVTQEAFTAVANSVGLEQDMSLDLSAATLNIIKNDKSVKEALIDLDAAFADAGKVDDVKINDATIVSNKIANIAVDGAYNASSNKIATKSTVTEAINNLDVNTDKGAASISGSTITINAVQQENGLIKDGTSTTINLDGTYNADTNKIATKSTVTDAINALDTTADVQAVEYTAASGNDGAKLTFKGVSETDGKIAQGTGATELQFAKVATTGAAADVTIADAEGHTEQTTVEDAIDEIYGRIEAIEGSFDVIKSVDAATTPAGVKWGDPEITGTLEASEDTFHKVYLVPAGGSEGNNTYSEYITTKSTSGDPAVTTYGWEKLGDIKVDLTGYAKSVTVNGKQFVVDTDSTNITLPDVITAINGETAIASGNTNFVKVTATTTKTAADGTNVTELSTTAKVQAVASADASNQGLAEASDVKAYVDGEIQKLDVNEYQQASVYVDTTNHVSTLKIKGIQETDGKIAAATTTPTTDVAIDGEYDETNNKIATKSTVTNVINGLDADITSDDAAVANVQVVETDGKITDVVVTNVSAGVTYTASTASTPANLAAGQTAAEQAGAVTGADIAAIKSYVDDKAALCWEEYQ